MAKGCDRTGCGEVAVALPVLLVHPLPPLEGTGELALGLAVCPRHMAETSAADLVGDEGWAMIAGVFAAMGRARPDRSTVEIRWDPLVAGQLPSWSSRRHPTE